MSCVQRNTLIQSKKGQELEKNISYLLVMKREVNGTTRLNENLKKPKTVLQLASKIRSALPRLWLVYNVRGFVQLGN